MQFFSIYDLIISKLKIKKHDNRRRCCLFFSARKFPKQLLLVYNRHPFLPDKPAFKKCCYRIFGDEWTWSWTGDGTYSSRISEVILRQHLTYSRKIFYKSQLTAIPSKRSLNLFWDRYWKTIQWRLHWDYEGNARLLRWLSICWSPV